MLCLLSLCGRLLVVHGISEDRDFLEFERETSFIFDRRATHGVHIIIVVHIYYDEGLLL